MTTDPFDSLLVVFAAGLGMLLVGSGNLLLGRLRPWARGVAIALPCLAVAAGVWATADQVEPVARAGAVGLAGAVVAVLAGTTAAARLGAALAAGSRRPAARWAALAVVGVVTAVGAVVRYEVDFEASADRALDELAVSAAPPDGYPPVGVRAETDHGAEIPLMEVAAPRSPAESRRLEDHLASRWKFGLITRRPAEDRTNCHGWVFAGGRYWVGGAVVEQILGDNGYRVVVAPRPGDLVVYRAAEGVAHTALVRYVADGEPVLVEGKWGAAGVYLHPAGESVYGAAFTYYRSPRSGHLLAGLGGQVSPAASLTGARVR